MKKTHALLLLIVILVVIIVIGIVTIKKCNNVKFDQNTDMNELITHKYSVTEIQSLQNAVPSLSMTFSDFKKKFKVQCARKTHQGFYVVLLIEDGRHAYICFNEDEMLYRVLVAGDFKSKEEFQNNVTTETQLSDVLKYDSNTLPSRVSAQKITIHIVKEGYFIVEYLRFVDGQLTDDPTVSSLTFYENDSLKSDEYDYAKVEMIPYIYEFDKRQ